MTLSKLERRARIKRRVRKTVSGTTERPRMSVYRSNKEIYAQLVDDTSGKTLVFASSIEKEIGNDNIPKIETSKLVGKLVAEKALKAGIKTVCFDRNGYLYHGRVKALAEGAREGGLNF